MKTPQAELLFEILNESKVIGSIIENDESFKKAFSRIYSEIFPLSQTLPTLIFGEIHNDPATSRVITRLIERLAEIKTPLSFYEEFPAGIDQETYYAGWREEIATGKNPYSEDHKSKVTTTPESRAAVIKLVDICEKYKIPVECVDHPDALSLNESYQSKEEFDKQHNSKSEHESLRESKFLNLRDDHMSNFFLSGNNIIARVGYLHIEGLQNRIKNKFSEAKKGAAVSSNYCFFHCFTGDPKFGDAIPNNIVNINLETMSEDQAVNLIIETANKAQAEMKTHGYWRIPHPSNEKNLQILTNLIKEISPELLNNSKKEPEKIITEECLETHIEEKSIDEIFSNPADYQKKVPLKLLLDKNMCPKILPQGFQEFLSTELQNERKQLPESFIEFLHRETLAGRFDILEQLKGSVLNFILKQTTLLHTAAASGNLGAVSFLLSQGAPLNITDIKNSTPLHIAARNGQDKVVRWLLSRGAFTNCQDHEGHTPAEVAINNLIKEMIEQADKNRSASKSGIFSESHPSASPTLLTTSALTIDLF